MRKVDESKSIPKAYLGIFCGIPGNRISSVGPRRKSGDNRR
ncbi:hypothetical protein NPIL_42101, partial [Nephila pilipes]